MVDWDELNDRAEREGWTQNETLMVALGKLDPDEISRRKRRSEETRRVEGLPVDQWPEFDLAWDLSREAQHRCLDGSSPEAIREKFAAGLILVCVSLDDLRPVLCGNSRRRKEEIWTAGSPSKAAGVLSWWAQGRRVTPPLLQVDGSGCVTVAGGNHRLAVADAKGAARILAYVPAAEEGDFLRLVPGAMVMPEDIADQPDRWDSICAAGTGEE